MNETGRLFVGCKTKIVHRSWNFGQVAMHYECPIRYGRNGVTIQGDKVRSGTGDNLCKTVDSYSLVFVLPLVYNIGVCNVKINRQYLVFYQIRGERTCTFAY